MMTTRRALLVGAGSTAAVAATIGLGTGSRTPPIPDLTGLVPQDADVLLLTRAGTGDRAIVARLGVRSGRTVARPVAPLVRGGFADVAALIDRASGVHVVAVGDVADLLVIETLLLRAGAASLHRIGDVLVTKFSQ